MIKTCPRENGETIKSKVSNYKKLGQVATCPYDKLYNDTVGYMP